MYFPTELFDDDNDDSAYDDENNQGNNRSVHITMAVCYTALHHPRLQM